MDGRRDEVLRWLRERGIDAGSAKAAVESELAKHYLTRFAHLVAPWYETPRHIEYLAGLLERVERGEIRKIAISAPPGHGKSTLLQMFVAWFLGRDPRRRILALSANESLSRRNSRYIRGFVQSEKWPWPGVNLVGESLEEWYTSEQGGVRAIGQTGIVTGYRAEMVLCDDVQPDAGNDSTRKLLEEWFRGILTTRLEPRGIVVIINTRWHDDDIIGRLMVGEDADEWVFVNLPAIAPEGFEDLLGRSPGEALWPERWPLDLLDGKRKSIGAAAFATQYQGDPVPVGTSMFRPEWLVEYDRLPDTFERTPLTLQVCDSAWKTGVRNDPTAIVTMVTDRKTIYITDVFYERVDYTDLKRVIAAQYEKHHPRTVYVEEASSGNAVLADLRRDSAIPVVGVKPGNQTKEARAEAVTGWFESGKVQFPRSKPWMGKVRDQFLRFPFGRHDDIVDAVVYGVLKVHDEVMRAQAEERWRSVRRRLGGWMAR